MIRGHVSSPPDVACGPPPFPIAFPHCGASWDPLETSETPDKSICLLRSLSKLQPAGPQIALAPRSLAASRIPKSDGLKITLWKAQRGLAEAQPGAGSEQKELGASGSLRAPASSRLPGWVCALARINTHLHIAWASRTTALWELPFPPHNAGTGATLVPG